MTKPKGWLRVSIWMPVEVRDWLKQRARSELTSIAGLFRRLVREYVLRVDRPAYEKIVKALDEKADADDA